MVMVVVVVLFFGAVVVSLVMMATVTVAAATTYCTPTFIGVTSSAFVLHPNNNRNKPPITTTITKLLSKSKSSTATSLLESSSSSLASSSSSSELNNKRRRELFKIDRTVDENTDTDNRKLVDVVQVTLPAMERYRNLTTLKNSNNTTKNDHSDDFDIYDGDKISLNPIIRKYRRLVSQQKQKKKNGEQQQLQQQLQQQQVVKTILSRLLSYPFSLLSSILRRWCISIVSSQRNYYSFFRRNSNGHNDKLNRRNRNANATIGGKKRHLILLLSSMLSGMFGGIRPVTIMSKSNDTTGGNASISRLEQTIHTHHHLDVSSYSSSSSSSTTSYGREWLNKNKSEKKKKNKI